MYKVFLNFAKSCVLSCKSIVDNRKKIHRAVFFYYKPQELRLRLIKGVLGGHTVAMVTY